MIASLEDASRLLRAVPGLGFAARPLYLLPLLRAGGLSVLLTSETADAGWARQFGAELLSLEDLAPTRGVGSAAGAMGELMDRLPGQVGARWQGRELALATYLSLRPQWQAALDRLGVRLVAVPPAPPASAVLVDKIAMRDWFDGLGIPTPASTVVGTLDHQELRRRFGRTFVAQQPRGSAGKGTYLVDGEEALRAVPAAERWLVSEYVGDTTLNFHGLVGADGTPTVLRPSLQLTDVAGIGSAFGWYSGCDYRAPALLPPAALTRCQELMERIGWGLAGLGYCGVFGADFAVQGESVAVLEMNCRLQGSTWLLGELELGEGALPTLLRHILERRGHSTAGKTDGGPVDAAQLAVRHTGPPRRLLAAPTGGRYGLDGGRLSRRGDAAGLLECGLDDCVLLGIPRPGTLVHPGAPLARLVSRQALTTPEGGALSPLGRQLVDALHGLYTFEADRTPC